MSLTLDAYIAARNGLIGKGLIAFDGHRYQVLSLPSCPAVPERRALLIAEDFEQRDPATIRSAILVALRSDE